MRVLGKRTATLAFATTAAAGLLLAATASPALADTVQVTYLCGTPGSVTVEPIDVTITAPATAVVGETVTLEVSTLRVNTLPFDVPAGATQVDMAIDLGGASAGSVTATGLSNVATPANERIQMVGGTAQLTLDSAGDVTLTPGGMESVIDDGTCTVDGTAPVAATIQVAAAR